MVSSEIQLEIDELSSSLPEEARRILNHIQKRLNGASNSLEMRIMKDSEIQMLRVMLKFIELYSEEMLILRTNKSVFEIEQEKLNILARYLYSLLFIPLYPGSTLKLRWRNFVDMLKKILSSIWF